MNHDTVWIGGPRPDPPPSRVLDYRATIAAVGVSALASAATYAETGNPGTLPTPLLVLFILMAAEMVDRKPPPPEDD